MNEKYLERLEEFDKLIKDNTISGRTVCGPLYDYFCGLIWTVGVTYCDISMGVINPPLLKGRWAIVKDLLKDIEDSSSWDGLISELDEYGDWVRHSHEKEPQIKRLKEIRKKAIEFRDWVITVGDRYYEKSKNFTFKQMFYKNLRVYRIHAEILLATYFRKDFKKGAPTPYEQHMEKRISKLLDETKTLEDRLKKEEITASDLDNLVELVAIISSFNGRENALLSLRICPKCGSKIEETQSSYGQYSDGSPTGIYYRVGCKDCDYVVHDETIAI